MRRLLEIAPVLLLVLLAACQTPTPAPTPAPPPAPVCPEPPPPPPPPEADALKDALVYAAELRTRSPAELAREATTLAALPVEPGGAMQAMRRALVLSQGRTPAELLQASTQLDIVNASTEPQAEPLKPLAALLGARIAEQRRLLDNVDKLNQQLRDSQRRTDQLNEKLEALKAIEQTLPVKPLTPPAGTGR